MVCKHCNSNNPDNAAFCNTCGKKLRGIYCPECNTHNEDGVILCKSCGARLDGVKTCIYCGAEINQNDAFCAQCGEQLIKSETPQVDASAKRAKTFRIIANALAIAISVLSVIFVVFMGCKTTMRVNTNVMSNDFHNTFYYFGDVWDELKSAVESYSDYGYNTTIDVAYFKAITGTVICASSLILALVFGIMAIVRSVKGIMSNEVRGGKSIAAFLAFVVGATGLVMLNCAYASFNYNGVPETMPVGFNDVTTAGLIVIGILVGAYAVMAILSNGAKQINKAFIVNGLFALGSLIIASVAVGLISNPHIIVTPIDSSYVKELGTNQFSLIAGAASQCDILSQQNKPNNFKAVIILGALSFIFAYFALVLLIKTIATNAKNLTVGSSEDMKGALIKSTLALLFSAAALITCIISVNTYNDELIKISWKNSLVDDYSFSYPWLIVLTVLSGVTFLVEIARKIVNNYFIEEY